MSAADLLSRIKNEDVKFVDMRFTDTRGKERHVSIPHGVIDDEFFQHGKMIDGSSIEGWCTINNSDLIFMLPF